MSFKVKASSPISSDLAPAGSHPAVLVALVDLGTHDRIYQNKKTGTEHRILMVWELTAEEARPLICKDFNLSLNSKAALRKFIEAWRGKEFSEGEEFEISKILGQACLLSIIHATSNNDNTYAKVEAVSKLPKGMKAPEPKRKPVSWEIDGKNLPDIDWLPYLFGRPVAEKIKESFEYKSEKPPAVKIDAAVEVGAGEADEAPF